MELELAELIAPVRAIATDAARRILEIYQAGFSIREKADATPVTEADLAAHTIIEQGLAQLLPGLPLLSEESSPEQLRDRRQWPWLWLVDPLDGTREFIRRSDEFSINIALIEQHRAVFGLILIPVSGVLYYGYRNGGAYRQDPGQSPRPIHTRKLGQRPARITGSRSARGSRTLKAYLDRVGRHDYLGVGSALKSCLIAEGQADLYPRFGPTGEWDTAAAQIIVEEAGGAMTDTCLRPLRYNARPTLINPDFFVFGDTGCDWRQYLPRRKPRL